MTTNDGQRKTIRVAAVQLRTRLGLIAENLEHATPLVEEAAEKGAQLVCLPELAASGYSMSPAIWEAGETRDGLTVQWLRETSHRLRITLGTGFVETDGKDFYNTYALGTPEGQIAGFIHKTMAERPCFRCSEGSHVIETSLGRIGVGICADNLFVANLVRMQKNDADILLMPHAAPVPFKAGGLVNEKDLPEARQSLSQMATDRARSIGIPVIFINQVGPRGAEKWFGILGAALSPEHFRLGGLSTIAGPDGQILGQLGELEEGVAQADVTLDGSCKVKAHPVGYGTYGGGFATPHPFMFQAICYTDAFFGGLSYRISTERRRKAREMLAKSSLQINRA